MSPLQACVQDSAGSSRPFLSLALTAGQSFLGMHCLTCISGGPSGWGGVGRIQWKESSGSQSRSSQPHPHRMTLGFQSQTPLFPGSREQRWWPWNRPWREKGRVSGAEVSPGLCDSRAATACCLMGGNQPIPPIGWTWEGRKTSPKLPFLPPLLSIQQHPWAHSVSYTVHGSTWPVLPERAGPWQPHGPETPVPGTGPSTQDFSTPERERKTKGKL